MKRLLAFFVLLSALFLGSCSHVDVRDGIILHFIDVGQGDSALIQYGGRGILIDGGEKNSGVLEYLRDVNVDELDYVIATHPHSDHIGGLAEVIEAIPVKNVMMPRAVANSVSYEKLLLSIKGSGLKITAPVVGETITLPLKLSSPDRNDVPDSIELIILGPNSDEYEDINNYSIVIKLIYGGFAFLFTGDAQTVSENEMLSRDLSADVLKVGHHGSRSSTSEEFLRTVEPRIAVISLGKDNSYGHPHQEVLDRLSRMNIRLFRTDEDGTIIMYTDGKDIYME